MKKFLLVFIPGIIALAVGFGLYFINKNNTPVADTGLKNINRNLSEDSRRVYMERIEAAEKDLAETQFTDKDASLRQTNNHLYLAQQYFGLGELEKSKQEYLKVLNFDSKNEAALVGLAYVFAEAGDLESAEKSLKTAIEYSPKNYSVWLQYIDINRTRGVSKEGVKALFEEALAATGRYIDVVTKAANFYEQIGEKDKAVSMWEEAIKSNPGAKKTYELEIGRLKSVK
ncbi:MAG: hypothetical protein JNN11_04930 [Candidatus Doudnabacteria bacterium]|nr:hypothetical protein [Candidatus Doudnabacteria bacterium]